MMEDVISRLREFMENEARSCSMEDIENGLTEIRKQG